MAAPERRIHREILQLTTLVIIALTAFIGTRALAAYNRRTNMADGAAWFERGRRALVAGDTGAAVDDFRRAAAKDRDARAYTLALARALERAGDAAASERALVALREVAPEDSEINLEIARLAASRGDLDEALRYYRNALYAPATAADAAMRRAIRLELIRFLLARNDQAHALPELLAAAADSPNDVSSAVDLGQLLMQAGDDRRAADQFSRGLRLDPRNVDALAGAGTAAFHLGRYADARRYLSAVGARAGAARDLLEIASLILANDPLGPRLASTERRRRLRTDLQAVKSHLRACGQAEGAGTIVQEVDAFAGRLRSRDGGDADVLDAGLDLIDRGERAAASCGTASSLDRGLLLIARLHGAAG